MYSPPSAACETLYALAFQYLRHGKTRHAQTLLEWLLEAGQPDDRVRMALAFAMLENGHPAAALRTLEPLDPSPLAVVQFLRMKAFAAQERWEDAVIARRRYCRLSGAGTLRPAPRTPAQATPSAAPFVSPPAQRYPAMRWLRKPSPG